MIPQPFIPERIRIKIDGAAIDNIAGAPRPAFSGKCGV